MGILAAVFTNMDTLLIAGIFCASAFTGISGEMSKAMKNILRNELDLLKDNENVRFENEKGNKQNMKNMKVKSFQELRNVFFPQYQPTQTHLQPSQCSGTDYLWDHVGEDHTWDLVFVDNAPMKNRTSTAERLLRRTKLLIIHDTEELILPHDFSKSHGSMWNSHPCFTDVSDEIFISMGLPGLGLAHLGDFEKQIWTTLIRGDLDKDGKVFDSVVKAFKDNFDDANAGYRFYNNENAAYGTHARLLLVAAMMTHGDILELGMGDHSTQLLHDILEEDNKSEKRMLVSAESDLEWLERFKIFSSSFHQILYVKKYK